MASNKHSRGRLSRRQMMKAMALTTSGAGAALSTTLTSRRGFAQTKKPKFLIVIAGAGGASLIDSFMAIRESEAGANSANLNCFPDSEVHSTQDSPFRAVALQENQVGAIPVPFTTDQRPFVQRHKDDLMVVTQTGTSVNHTVAQKRSITGNDAWNGRTLQEAVATEYGMGMPIPNVNMTGGGYILPGIDPTTPDFAYAEPVAQAHLWPLSLDGAKGLKDTPSPQRLFQARQLRNQRLESESTFFKTFQDSPRLKLWQKQRDSQSALETLDLITKLNILPNNGSIPLNEYGLNESPDGRKVRQVFPNYLEDPLEAQAALAFLLIKNQVSCTVTISPSFSVLLKLNEFPPKVTNPPLAFDFSHQSHRAAQAVMWDRILGMADRLIGLLKNEEFESGTSYWDRSMIYFASDFGRTKRRPGRTNEFGSSHDLNNGFAVLSPMVNGNKILGGVDPTTGMTYGFDPEDPQGVPRPGTHMEEAQIYSGLLHALDVDTSGSGLPDMRAMRKNA